MATNLVVAGLHVAETEPLVAHVPAYVERGRVAVLAAVAGAPEFVGSTFQSVTCRKVCKFLRDYEKCINTSKRYIF